MRLDEPVAIIILIVIFSSGLILGSALELGGEEPTKEPATTAEKDSKDYGAVGAKAEGYMKYVILSPEFDTEILNVSEAGNLLRIDLKVSRGTYTKEGPLFVTEDGQLIFSSKVNTSVGFPPQTFAQKSSPNISRLKKYGHVRGEGRSIAMFCNYQAESCAQAFSNLEKLGKEYSFELVYLHFYTPSRFPRAEEASLAAECAGEKGKFWEYSELLFENQGQWQGKEDFLKYAEELGLEKEEFAQCLESERHIGRLHGNIIEGKKLYVTDMSTIIADKNISEGKAEYEELEKIVQGNP